MSRWKLFRYRLEETACRLLAAAIPRLSRRACVRVSQGLGALAFLVDRRGRAVALANLECVFGDRFSPAQRIVLARASFQNFARTMFDLFWVTRLTPENYTEWIQMEGLTEVQELMRREKRGAVFACSHFGNWEWANHGGAYAGTKAVTVAENFKNPRLTALFKTLREHSGATLIPQENSLLRMLKTVKRGGPTSLMVDLNLPPTQAATVIQAFRAELGGEGLAMCVPILHAVLAQRAGAFLAPIETEPRADGTYRIIVHPPVEVGPEDSLQVLAQKCWDAFEPFIRARPELYIWPYKHFRYRPKHTTRTYPFYANSNGKFEKLLREAIPPSPPPNA